MYQEKTREFVSGFDLSSDGSESYSEDAARAGSVQTRAATELTTPVTPAMPTAVDGFPVQGAQTPRGARTRSTPFLEREKGQRRLGVETVEIDPEARTYFAAKRSLRADAPERRGSVWGDRSSSSGGYGL